jgi:FixJ family two-component response regulator
LLVAERAREPALEQTTSRKVYVVDDDDAVRDSMRALLESSGMDVLDYSSAQEFLVHPCKRRGCLLLDLHMPGMSGVELLEALRMQGSRLPVIAITGRSDPVLKERVMRAGALAFLDKPIDETLLMDALSRAFALT